MLKKLLGIGLIFLIILLLNNTIIFPIPFGKILNPFNGYAALINSDKLPNGDLICPELIDTVNIKWDHLRVPHIQAKNESDLYFMQGYIMAFDRLWQMEFQTHAAAGRMSEILGDKALDFDRFQRRIGMTYGATNTLNEIQKDKKMYELLQSFTDGINFYITSLDKSKHPIEYKILNYEPELWTPLKTSLLLKSMAWSLTNRTTDLEYTKILNDFGIDVIEELFPIFPHNHEPIVPLNTNLNYNPLIKYPPDSLYKSKNYKINTSNNQHSSLGSNNWVMSGNRTMSKSPILSNDPHLNLSLPSIWYLMHLQCPTMNVMGVTIPGAPGIIIGFNDNISWGVTNGYDDAMDWYDITFYNSEKTDYKYDGEWLPVKKIIEEIKIKGKPTFYDTIVYTHHGPVVWDNTYNGKNIEVTKDNVGLALHWLAHGKSNELLTFYSLNKASNYDEFQKSLIHYICPGQNFIYSDINNNIAIFHSGKSPIKWKRQGMFISDGTNKYYDWNDYIPFNHRPSMLNPKKGYLSSANQNPVNRKYPYYLSEYFAPSYRGTQINVRLDTLYKASIDDMMSIQLDNTSLIAKNILPQLLQLIDLTKMNYYWHKDSVEYRHSDLVDAKEDSLYVVSWINILKEWNYQYDKKNIASPFFDKWLKKVEEYTWEDEFDNIEYIWPEIDKLEELIIHYPNSKWFDNKNTNIIETLIDICNQSFYDVCKNDFNIENFSFDSVAYRKTDINHLAKIPEFSNLNLITSGAENIINATRNNEGPSFRYIIDMNKPYKIKGIYPGGQSGFPGSFYYDNFTQDWVEGEYYDLVFPNNNDKLEGIELKCIPSN